MVSDEYCHIQMSWTETESFRKYWEISNCLDELNLVFMRLEFLQGRKESFFVSKN